MKTILVPTDFSDNTAHIIDYAAELAKSIHAKIILFHVYHPPVMITEIPNIQPLTEIEEMCMSHLEKIAENVHHKYGSDLVVKCQCQCGFAVDEISYYQEEHKIDLIVMGMKGAGYLSERLMGSITTTLIYKANCPVMAIGENVVYRPIHKIALACDFLQLENRDVFEPVKTLAQLFGAHVYILNIVPKAEDMLSIHDSPAGIRLERALQSIDHSVHYSKNKDVVDGINEFIHTQDMDLVVMIPRTHSILENIFKQPNTKRMAFHSDIPLLALCDGDKPGKIQSAE